MLPTARHRALLRWAGYLIGVIAAIHIGALFVGASALDYLDAPDLAEMLRNGSLVPIFATLGVAVIFLVFAAYALSGAGALRPLPKLRHVLLIIGSIFVFRGLGVAWFAYLVAVNSPEAIVREIFFSLVALIVGIMIFVGRKIVR